MTAMLHINAVPLQAITVDLGRVNKQHLGLCQSGPMDWFAYQVNNALLGNTKNTAQIELTVGEFRGRFDSRTVIAVTGACSQVFINERQVPAWQRHVVNAGDDVSISTLANGNIVYLGVAHGFNIAKCHDSSCAVTRENLGGLKADGRPLASGDCISYQQGNSGVDSAQFSETALVELIDFVYRRASLALLPGSCQHHYDPLQWQSFLEDTYQVDAKSNRMGYRLTASKSLKQKVSMRSIPLVMGSMQLPPDGNPIIMLADRQTLGGYPQIAIVSRTSIPALVQRGVGASFTVHETEVSKALFEYRQICTRLKRLFDS